MNFEYIFTKYPLTRATSNSNGLDIKNKNELVIYPNETVLAETGIVLLQEDTHALLLPRSSLHKLGLTLANTIGLIDTDYRGEVLLALRNTTNETITIPEGTSLCQLLIYPNPNINFISHIHVIDKTRDTGGFGSTNDSENN